MLLNGNELSQIIQGLSIYFGISIQCDPIIGKEKVYGKLDLKDDIDAVSYTHLDVYKRQASSTCGVTVK